MSNFTDFIGGGETAGSGYIDLMKYKFNSEIVATGFNSIDEFFCDTNNIWYTQIGGTNFNNVIKSNYKDKIIANNYNTFGVFKIIPYWSPDAGNIKLSDLSSAILNGMEARASGFVTEDIVFIGNTYTKDSNSNPNGNDTAVYKYTISTDTLKQLNDVSNGYLIKDFNFNPVTGKNVAIGGHDYANNTNVKKILTYDASNDSWTVVKDLTSDSSLNGLLSAAYIMNDGKYLLQTSTNNIYIYDSSADSLTSVDVSKDDTFGFKSDIHGILVYDPYTNYMYVPNKSTTNAIIMYSFDTSITTIVPSITESTDGLTIYLFEFNNIKMLGHCDYNYYQSKHINRELMIKQPYQIKIS